ncbi:MAG: hypothetical protein ACREIF_08465, partial [Chthoniobacterales bacterium]
HGTCCEMGMQTTLPLHHHATSQPSKTTAAADEIQAFVAARNLFLREAISNATEANLRRAAAANEFVKECLHPARVPYEAQALPEAEAARERRHCETVKVELDNLRTRSSLCRHAA